MNTLTAKEILDIVEARLNDGTGRASKNSMGVYRTTDGRACAVGVLLTDDEVPADNQPIGAMHRNNLLPERLVPHLGLLSSLQNIHDYAFNWEGNEFIASEQLEDLRKEYTNHDTEAQS